MAELRNRSQIVFQDGAETLKFPPDAVTPLFEKSVGAQKEVREFRIPSGGTSIITLWSYSDRSKLFDFFAMYNETGSGVIDIEYVIGKPTSSTNFTQSGAWTPDHPSLEQLSCGAMLQKDSPFVLIPDTRADLNDAADYEAAVEAGDVSTGCIYAIKASNQGTTDVIVKTLTVWSEE